MSRTIGSSSTTRTVVTAALCVLDLTAELIQARKLVQPARQLSRKGTCVRSSVSSEGVFHDDGSCLCSPYLRTSHCARRLPAIAADDGKVKTFSQAETLGYYRGAGRRVSRLRAGEARPGNKVAPIWAFTNGDEGQQNVIDTVPGRSDYTPLWAVRLVTWRDGTGSRRPSLRRAVAGPPRRPALDQGGADRRQLPRVVGSRTSVVLDLDEAVVARAPRRPRRRARLRGAAGLRRAAASLRGAGGTSPRSAPACAPARNAVRATDTPPPAGRRRSVARGRCRSARRGP